MNRREFFTPAKRSSTAVPLAPPSIEKVAAPNRTNRGLATGIAPYAGAWSHDQVIHLLRRTMFGAKMADINYFKGKTMSQAVDELLTVSTTPPSPPINNYSNGANKDPNIAEGATWVNGPEDPNFNGQRRQSLKYWYLGEMINQDRSILEKMTLFWHNHFATETNVYNSSILGYNHLAMLRANAMGDFRSLVKKVTIDPAMLAYLNGNQNTKNAPDENYARELQELFTVGKDLPNHFTEDDVKAAAKVLTGWRINKNTFQSYFDSTKHDTSSKQFSAFYANTVVAGKSGATAGDAELDDLLTMIFNQQETAKYLCRKLYRWFVYYDIDAATETNVIEPLATIFRNSGYDIKTVLAALFKSEHFFDAANMGCLIKSPLDFNIGFMRQFDLKFPSAAGNGYVNLYFMWGQIWAATYIQQQDPLDPPNVAGWPAYYQLPGYHELWINHDTLPKRNQISDVLVYVGLTRSGFTLIMDTIAVAKMMSKPDDPNQLIDDLCKYLHATLSLTKTEKDAIKVGSLLSFQTQDYYWTNAWNDHINDPTSLPKKAIVTSRLQVLLKYLMNLSEYQLS